MEGCAQYLDGVGKSADIVPLWRQLAEQALNNNDVQVDEINRKIDLKITYFITKV